MAYLQRRSQIRLYYDIEANGFLETATVIHCICTVDLDNKTEKAFGPAEIQEGLEFLARAEQLVAHNGIKYDFPCIKKIYPEWHPIADDLLIQARQGHLDTLVLARLAYPNVKVTDSELVQKGRLPSALHGKDSLEAWGHRVGLHKAKYDGGFEKWSQEMQDYCLQDCRTGAALWDMLKVHEMDPRAVELEHRVAFVCNAMTEAGWPFSERKAGELYTRLVAIREVLEDSLKRRYGSWEEVDKVFVPKVNNAARGYVKGVEFTKMKTVTFNPGSRQHAIKKLMEAGWEPEVFTPSGQAKLDEDILESLDIPEAKQLVEYLLVQKRLGQLADGENGWLKLVSHGKIHGAYNPMGTVTGRASHMKPNIGQVPKVGSPYGEECRELFEVPPGWLLVGADMQGLELRCLSSYMARFDNGEYGKIVVDGDPHSVNQAAAGLPTRDNAKTFIYAFLYGAGDEKIGKIIGKGKSAGGRLKQTFLEGLPALGRLKTGVGVAAKKGYLLGLDGRHIPVRSSHAALNSLLQSAGAVLCKTWLADVYDFLTGPTGLKWGWDGDFVIVGWIHDELQVACRSGLEHVVGEALVVTAQRASARYKFRCRLDAEYKVGSNWKETH